MRLSSFVLLAALICPAPAWITITQAKHGVSIGDIYNASIGVTDGNPELTLGYRWSMPTNVGDHTGLGGTITWAWDARLCDKLYIKDQFWFISLVNCDGVRSSMHRAFDTWSMNSKFIKFTDVTEQCTRAGYVPPTYCPYAEVVVSFVPPLPANETFDADAEPAESASHTKISTTFTATSGERPVRGFGNKAVNMWFTVFRPVIETIGGTINFRTDVCWYVDSEFCQGFHDWKRQGGSVGANFTFSFFFLIAWFIAVGFMLYHVALIVKSSTKLHAKLLTETGVDVDGDGLDDPTMTARVETFFAVVAEFPLRGTTLGMLVIMIPWSFFSAVRNCWDCYDFEAAAAHEIGHLLGLGHPDLASQETLPGFLSKGTSSYQMLLAGGERLNATTCVNPWTDVYAGVPPNSAATSVTNGFRRSIMEKLTQDPVSTCLQADDLEALNVLYPDCGGGPVVPVCNKSALNLGWMRIMLFFIGPISFALLAAAVLLLIARRCRARAYNQRAAVRDALDAEAAEAEAAELSQETAKISQ